MNADTPQTGGKLDRHVAEVSEKEQAASHETNTLEEIRKLWVDSPLPSFFTCHRKLAKYSRELKVMKLTLRDYAHSGEENDPNVLKAVYDYVSLTHLVYLKALYESNKKRYIEDANKKLKQNISIPALPHVQKLLSEYDSTINKKLRCYYDKAKRPVTERSESSTEPSVTEISNLSRESQEIISRIMQDYAEQITQMSEQMIDMAVSAEVEKQKAEHLEEEKGRLTAQMENMSEKNVQNLMEKRKQRDDAIKEKGEMLKQKFQLEKEVARLRNLSNDAMFPDATRVNFLLPLDEEPSRNFLLPQPAVPLSKQDESQRVKRPSTSQSAIEIRQMLQPSFKPMNACDKDQSVSTQHASRRLHREGQSKEALQDAGRPKNSLLKSGAPKFVPKPFGRRDPPAQLFSTPHNIGGYYHTTWDYTKPKVINESKKETTDNAFSSVLDRQDECPNHSLERPTYPWEQECRTRIDDKSGAHELLRFPGRMHTTISAKMLDLGGTNGNRKFGGKKSDYPMVRQQLLKDYHLYWKSDPYLLLQRIANSVSDSVYEHIKCAWVMRDPRVSLNQIWEILENLYGDPQGLLENAIREIKWYKGSLASKVTSLQTYPTKLRNLRSIAQSIDMVNELSRPKLVFRIVDCFNSALYAQFAQENKDFKTWQFGIVLKFIDEQISNLQFKEKHCYDPSTIMDEERTHGSR